ncbi:MAG: hypothetical protein KDA32_02260 [Phycisphaerales bacterium]|nr:hypothetical protein [Phycisphaerales bacterium]
MPDQPTFEALLAYALGDATDADTIRRAVAGNSEAARTLRTIESTLTAMRTDDSEAPSPEALRRAMAIMTPKPQKLGWLETIQRVVADLVFDSRLQPALAGFRSASAGVQLVFQSEVGEIELQVAPRPSSEGEGWVVTGQMTPMADDVEIVVLSGDGDVVTTTMLDDAGMFTFPLETDTFQLMIRAGSGAIVIPQVDIE